MTIQLLLIIIRVDTLPSTDKLAITSYLACFARKKRVEQICFL